MNLRISDRDDFFLMGVTTLIPDSIRGFSLSDACSSFAPTVGLLEDLRCGGT